MMAFFGSLNKSKIQPFANSYILAISKLSRKAEWVLV